MATMTISLPDPMKEWIEAKVAKGDYASTSDYVRDLVRRDRGSGRTRYPEELTVEDLQRIVAESDASGMGTKSVEEIFAEAVTEARVRGYIGE